MVVRDTDWKCYSLNSQGPCGPSQRIVYTKRYQSNEVKTKYLLILLSLCPYTTCREYSDDKNTACSNNTISYEGKCLDPEDPASCGTVAGHRLVPNRFGEYSCQCASALGFLELDGKCWPRYLQGPCGHGYQVAKNNEGEVICRKDPCAQYTDQPLVLGPSDICYQLRLIFSKFAVQDTARLYTAEETNLFEEDYRITNSSSIQLSDPALRVPCSAVHCTCKNVAKTTGACLEDADINPEIYDEEFDFLALINEFESPTVNQIKDEIIVEQIIEKSLVLRNITDLVTVRKAFNEVFNSSDHGEGVFSVNS